MNVESSQLQPAELRHNHLERWAHCLAALRATAGRVALASVLTMTGAATSEIAFPAVAQADSIDDALASYPDKAMPCEHPNANGQYLATGPCANYDWGPKHTAAYNDPSEISSRGYAYRNCTDWVAFSLNQAAGIVVSKSLGNGGDWYNHAPASQRSFTPRPWDAAVVPATYDSSGHETSYGHVAFVESVSPDGKTMTVSEYNHDGLGDGDQRAVAVSGAGFTEFVDFGVHPTSPAASAPPTKAGIVAFEPNGTPRYMQGISNGSGQFAWNYSNLNNMQTPTQLEMGTVNADKKADIVAFEPTGTSIGRYMVAMSNGDGTFDWGSSNLTNMQEPSDFAVGDINGDNLADIVDFEPNDGTHTGRFMAGIGAGNGNFNWHYTNLVDIQTPVHFELGDVDGDKKADIVAFEPTSPGTGHYMVGRSAGDGRFGWDYTNLSNMQQPAEFAVGDVTGDTKADIVAFETTGAGAGRYMRGIGNGDNTFGWGYTNLTNMQQPTTFELGDFNADGKNDIVAYELNDGSHEGRYMQGSSNGNGQFNWGYSNLNGVQTPTGFALGSFTGQ